MKHNEVVRRLGLAVIATVALRADDCGTDVIRNPGFELWCGDALCGWELDAGEVRRVPTWHRGDSGIQLVGSTTQISQYAEVDASNVWCLRFDLIADVAEDAQVYLEMDFLDDGVSEVRDRIPASDWRPLRYLVTTPTWFRGVRFILRKEAGGGDAVVAQVAATTSEDCTGEPVELQSRPSAAPCSGGAECSSGTCGPTPYGATLLAPAVPGCVSGCPDEGRCADCATDAECGGATCGIAFADLGPYRSCGPAARHVLGERCFQDAECATGSCCQGICSTCCDDVDCGAGSCERRGTVGGESVGDPEEFAALVALPYQCAPATGASASGEPCLEDVDCASGACSGEGPLEVCVFDGRRCATDADCPLGGLFDEPACVSAGIAGGTCQ